MGPLLSKVMTEHDIVWVRCRTAISNGKTHIVSTDKEPLVPHEIGCIPGIRAGDMFIPADNVTEIKLGTEKLGAERRDSDKGSHRGPSSGARKAQGSPRLPIS